ncbi:MAG: hypothetical protein QXZ43_04315 [Candidatus Aenigmatarchaeota archaeon]
MKDLSYLINYQTSKEYKTHLIFYHIINTVGTNKTILLDNIDYLNTIAKEMKKARLNPAHGFLSTLKGYIKNVDDYDMLDYESLSKDILNYFRIIYQSNDIEVMDEIEKNIKNIIIHYNKKYTNRLHFKNKNFKDKLEEYIIKHFK